MVLVTLVGECLAKEGETFVYKGPLKECRDCRLKTVCFNLSEGRLYRVVSVRSKHHGCHVFDSGVRVVEVERIPVEVATEARQAVEGMILTLGEVRCRELGCEHYDLCHAQGVREGERYRVRHVLGDVACPKGRALKRLVLEEPDG